MCTDIVSLGVAEIMCDALNDAYPAKPVPLSAASRAMAKFLNSKDGKRAIKNAINSANAIDAMRRKEQRNSRGDAYGQQ